MSEVDERANETGAEETGADETTARTGGAPDSEGEPLYFFPDREVTEAELRAILASEDHERRAWAVSHMLRYAQWEDLWTYVDRDDVREIFGDLDLPDNLRSAWARMLKIETPVG
jgi:hypothetical protein